MEFNIECDELNQDFHEIGLSIGFHAKDKIKLKPEETNIKKLLASIGDYFTINVTFGEDDNFGEYEEDYIYVESNFEEFCGELDEFVIIFNEKRMLVKNEEDTLEIKYNIDSLVFEELLKNISIIDPDKNYINQG